MAQDGDTITYTFIGGTVVSEDVSTIDEVFVDYLDGSGASSNEDGAAGGRAENVTINVSSVNTLYIWVGGTSGEGRYSAGAFGDSDFTYGGGSTEISFSNTDESDSSNEPVLVGAGGGGTSVSSGGNGGGGGARGGAGGSSSALGVDGGDGAGTPPPQGGDGASSADLSGEGFALETPGEGYINTNASEVSGGSTTTGGGSPAGTDGEITLEFKSNTLPVTIDGTELTELTIDGDPVIGLTIDGNTVF